jgi:hypothetical protein
MSSSLTLHSQPGVKWRHDEWDAMTGASDCSIASMAIGSVTWDTSIMMPRRFISATTSSPKGLSVVEIAAVLYALSADARGAS